MKFRCKAMRTVSVLLCLTFLVWQIAPSAYALNSQDPFAPENFSDPSINPQTPTMLPGTETPPDDSEYINGIGPGDEPLAIDTTDVSTQPLTEIETGALSAAAAVTSLAITENETFGTPETLPISPVAAPNIAQATLTGQQSALSTGLAPSVSLENSNGTNPDETLLDSEMQAALNNVISATDSSLTLGASSQPVPQGAVEPDTQAPVISPVTPIDITSAGLTLMWTTNEASDTQIEYGLNASYGQSTTLAPSLVTEHSQALAGLQASTTYHYRILSRDAAGNLQTSEDLTFTTSALAVAPGITNPGMITTQGGAISWTGAPETTYEVQISRDANFSSLVQLQNSTVAGPQFQLPDFSQGSFYIRVRAIQGAEGSQTPLTEWSAGQEFAMNVTYSPYLTPLSYAQGGTDVNILEWDSSGAGSGQSGVRIYRQVFGSGVWTLIADVAGENNWRYTDSNIDSSQVYMYRISVYWPGQDSEYGSNIEQFNLQVNYTVPEGLTPQNVLVLINTRDDGLGLVDIAAPVNGAETSGGALDPITETQLMTHLGYVYDNTDQRWENGAGEVAWQDSDQDGTFVLTDWYITKDPAGTIKVPLGIYYALRRDIPMENVVFVSMPTGERDSIPDSDSDGVNDFDEMIQTIHDAMVNRGIASRILSVVSAYHFPLVHGGGHGWVLTPDQNDYSWEFGVNNALWQSFVGSDQIVNGNLTFSNRDAGHLFSRQLGSTGFLTTRIDAVDEATARRMIDDAIWAEHNYSLSNPDWIHQMSDLMAYIDWAGPYGQGDDFFHQAEDILRNSGLFGTDGANLGSAPDITAEWVAAHPQYDQDGDGRLDSTFLYTGWYNPDNYQDLFDWARGSIGLNLDSFSGTSFRGGNSWGSNILSHGGAATVGAVNEPSLTGHTLPQLFNYYLLSGYSFAEAAQMSSTSTQMAFNGDALYTPFAGLNSSSRVVSLTVNGQAVERHILGEGSYGQGISFQIFRDYDSSGRLIREQTALGHMIEHLSDGRTVVYAVGSTSYQMSSYQNDYMRNISGGRYNGEVNAASTTHMSELFVYGTDGVLIMESYIPCGAGDWVRDEIVTAEDGSIRIVRHYEDPNRIDTFSQEGFLLTLDGSGHVAGASVVKPHYFYDGATLQWTTTYEVIGNVVYQARTVGAETRLVMTRVEFAAGGRLEWNYAENSFNAVSVSYYNAAGVLLSEAVYTEGVFELKDTASGTVLGQFVFKDWEEMEDVFRGTAGAAQLVTGGRDRIIHYLMVRHGMTRAQAEGEAVFDLSRMIVTASGLEQMNFQGQEGAIYWLSGNAGQDWNLWVTFEDLAYSVLFDSSLVRIKYENSMDPETWATETHYTNFAYTSNGDLIGYYEQDVGTSGSPLGHFYNSATGEDHVFAEYVGSPWQLQVHVGDPEHGSVSLSSAFSWLTAMGYSISNNNNSRVRLIIGAPSVARNPVPALTNQSTYHFEYTLDNGATFLSSDLSLAEGANTGLTVSGVMADGKSYSISLPAITLNTTPVIPPTITNPGMITAQGGAIGWTAVTGATGYEVQISWSADFSDLVQLQNSIVAGPQFQLPDFSQGSFYIRVRALQGEEGSQTPLTEWSAGQEFAMNVTYNPLQTPLAAAYGGTDVNILDWTPSADPAVTGYNIYRRVFGADCASADGCWELVHNNGNMIRYFDPVTNANIVYQYQVRAVTAAGEVAVNFNQSANYAAAYQGLQPNNVLVLINTTEGGLGYVNLSGEVPGIWTPPQGVLNQTQTGSQILHDSLHYNFTDGVWHDAQGVEVAGGTESILLSLGYTAITSLQQITEAQLLDYLGNPAWSDPIPDGNGGFVRVLGNWYVVKKADGTIEVPLGIYYAYRRQIPRSNIVFVSMPTSETASYTDDQFNTMITTIHDHMVNQGIASQILSVVSAYHFPLRHGGQYWSMLQPGTSSWEAALNQALWQSFGGAYDRLNVTYDQGHHFSRILGDWGFLTARLDAADIDTVIHMIDDSIWAEENYQFGNSGWTNPGLNAFIDYYGLSALPSFLDAASLIGASGFFGAQGANWDSQANILNFFAANSIYDLDHDGQIDSAFLNEPDVSAFYQAHPTPSSTDVFYFLAAHSDYDQNHDGRLDDTFLFAGWYDPYRYQDYFNWARGAIGWSLDSFSGLSFADWQEFYASPGFDLSEFFSGDTGFASTEFSTASGAPNSIPALCAAIQASNYGMTFASADNTLARLNEILETSGFYEAWLAVHGTSNSSEINNLVAATADFRGRAFTSLTADQQGLIRLLNRYLLEQAYPANTPKRAASIWRTLGVIQDAQYNFSGINFSSTANTLERLNEIIQIPNLYELWLTNPNIPSERRAYAETIAEIRNLILETASYRNKPFDQLTTEEQGRIMGLNRLLLSYTHDGYYVPGTWGGNAWGANITNSGAAATLGAVNEPMLSGHTSASYFMYYLLQGFSFAEAGHFGTFHGNSSTDQMAFNGDPLYSPFNSSSVSQVPRIVAIQVGGVTTGYRYYYSEGPLDPGETPDWSMNPDEVSEYAVYQDFDLNGRLVGEQLANGTLIRYLPDGRVVFYEQRDPDFSSQTNATSSLRIYSPAGNLVFQGSIPLGGSDVSSNEIVLTAGGAIEIHRHYTNSSREEVFTQDGILVQFSPSTLFTWLMGTPVPDGTQDPSTGWYVTGVERFYDTVLQCMRTRYVIGGQVSFVSGSNPPRIASIVKSDGIRLNLVYDAEGHLQSAVYLNAAGQPLVSVSKNDGNEYYSMTDQATGWVLQNVSVASAIELFKIAPALTAYAAKMKQLRAFLIKYLIAEGGIPSEVEARIPMASAGVVSMAGDLNFLYYFVDPGSSPVITYRPPAQVSMLNNVLLASDGAVLEYTGRAFTKTLPDGTKVYYKAFVNPLTFKKIAIQYPDGSKHEYSYNPAPERTLFVDTYTDALGQKTYFDSQGNIVGSAVNGVMTFHVDPSGQCLKTLSDALKLAQPGDVIEFSDGTYLNVIATAVPAAPPAIAPVTPLAVGTDQSTFVIHYSVNGVEMTRTVPLIAGENHCTVGAVDMAGTSSNVLEFVITQGVIDSTPPVISAILVNGLTFSGATFTWTTDEAADSQIEYGLNASYGQSTTLAPSLVTEHSQALAGLQASTTYHYRILSRDAAGNLQVSEDLTFTTSAAPDITAPVISAILVNGLTFSGATFTWTTNEASDTQIEYGLNASYGQSTTLAPSLVTEHSQALVGLQASTTYHYRILSRDAAGNLQVSEDLTFTTSAAPDITAPVISAILVGGFMPTGATITWTTNEASVTQIEYGLNASYGQSTTLAPSFVTEHSQGLSGLQASTTYHYRILSRDAAGNLQTSEDLTFTTASALIVPALVTPNQDRTLTITLNNGAPNENALTYTPNLPLCSGSTTDYCLPNGRLSPANVGSTQVWIYTPNAYFVGTEYFTYSFTDGAGNPHQEEVALTLDNEFEGLLLQLQLDEGSLNSGSTATSDASGNNAAGTVTNGTWTDDHVVGSNALQFIAANQTSVSFADSGALDISSGGAFSSSLWFNPEAGATGNQVLFSNGTNYELFMDATGHLGFSGDGNSVLSNISLTIGQWQHIVTITSGSQTQIYINGVLQGTLNIGVGAANQGPLLIGRNAAGNYLNGIMDNAFLYGRILSVAEIQELYLLGKDMRSPAVRVEVWIGGTATDPSAPLGSQNNPYDISTADKFDALMNSFGENTTIHIAAGVYETQGYNYANIGGWKPKAGWKIIGSGEGATTLRLVDAGLWDESGAQTNLIGNDYDQMMNYLEISDLTLDCNFNGQMGVATGGIVVSGSHIYIHRVEVINFGTNAGIENFSILVMGGHPNYGDTYDVVIEDVNVHQPGTGIMDGFNGVSFITIAGVVNYLHEGDVPYNPTGSGEGFVHGAVIRNSRVDGNGLHASWVNGAGITGCFGGLVENNAILNVEHGIYSDSWRIQSLTIRANTLTGVQFAILFNNGEQGLVENLVIEDNTISLDSNLCGTSSASYCMGISFQGPLRTTRPFNANRIVIRNNTINIPGTLVPSNQTSAIYLNSFQSAVITGNTFDWENPLIQWNNYFDIADQYPGMMTCAGNRSHSGALVEPYPPVFSPDLPRPVVQEGESIAFSVPTSAAIASGHAWNVVGLPAGAVFVPGTAATPGSFNWTPGTTQAGRYIVTFQALNADGSVDFTISTILTVGNSVENYADGITATWNYQGPGGSRNDAYHFDGTGTSSIDNSGNSVIPSGNTAFSLGFWFQADEIPADGVVGLFTNETYLSSGFRCAIINGKLTFWSIQSGGGIWVQSDQTLQAGQWYYAVVSYDGLSAAMYLNTAVTQSSSVSQAVPGAGITIVSNANSLLVGGGIGGVGNFQGLIDELIVWNRSLSGNEVASLYGSYNSAPVANSPVVPAFNQNTPETITLSGTDADNNLLTYTIVQGPAHGILTVDPNNPSIYVYTPAANYSGADSFTYMVNDGIADSNVATVSLTIRDITAPVISAILVNGLTFNGATFTWTTNEAADSQMEYGLNASYGQSTTLAPSLVTEHSQALAGLQASTTYHYRILSRDAAGNLQVSEDLTFTTSAAPDITAPVISAILVNGLTFNGATFTWTTNEAADSQIEYGLTASYGQSTTLDPSFVTEHSQDLTGLQASTIYHYRIRSRDAAGNLQVSEDLTFTTSAAPDITAPVISAILVSGLTFNGATFTWTTNEAADSQIEYGLTASYGQSTTPDPSLATSHSQGLTGLQASTTYHYRVLSRDAAGNLQVSEDLTCTTSAAPLAPVTGITTSLNGSGQTVLAFNAVPGAVLYQVQISMNSDFTNIVYEGFPTGLSETVDLANGNYHVRVRASMSQQVETGPVTPWAEADFSVDRFDGGSVSITGPATAEGPSFVLSWNPVAGAAIYEVQVSTTADFSTILSSSWPTSPTETFAPTTNGTYYYRVRAWNALPENNGIATPLSAVHQVVFSGIDVTPPVIVLPQDLDGSRTNQASLTVTYTADGQTRTRDFTLSPANGGVNHLSITEADALGNETTVNFTVTLDTTGPAVVVTGTSVPGLNLLLQSPAPVTNQLTLTVNFTVDGAPQTQTFTLSEEGENTIVIPAQQDSLGNITPAQTYHVMRDTTAPVIHIQSVIPMVTNQAQLTVTYRLDDDPTDLYQVFNLALGDNGALEIVASDPLGNTRRFPLSSVRYELETPALVIVSVVPTLTNQPALIIQYRVEGSEELRSASFTLVEGPNLIAIDENDSEGNPIRRSFGVTLDTTPPVVALVGDLPESLPIPAVYVTYSVDGAIQMIVLPLVEGDNLNLEVTAMDAAGNETVLHLPNVRYEKPPAVEASTGSELSGGYAYGENENYAPPSTMAVADFHIYLQSLNLSAAQMMEVGQSLGQIQAGTFVYRYETASGPSFSWMESSGRTRVFSFENNMLLFGDLLTPILS